MLGLQRSIRPAANSRHPCIPATRNTYFQTRPTANQTGRNLAALGQRLASPSVRHRQIVVDFSAHSSVPRGLFWKNPHVLRRNQHLVLRDPGANLPDDDSKKVALRFAEAHTCAFLSRKGIPYTGPMHRKGAGMAKGEFDMFWSQHDPEAGSAYHTRESKRRRPNIIGSSYSHSRHDKPKQYYTKLTNNTKTRRTYATLAPNHRNKERTITWRGVTEEQEKDDARAAFHRSNPFNDPKAHNCVMIIPNVPFVITEDGEHSVIKTHELFEPQAAIVGTEVSKLLAKAGKPEATWPVIWELDDNDLHFYFKVPHGEDLQALEARIVHAGLVGGRFEELGSEWDEWWYSTLHYLVKKGHKMW